MSRASSLVMAAAGLVACSPLAASTRAPDGPGARVSIEHGVALLKKALHLEDQHTSHVTTDSVLSHTISIGSREASLELDLKGGASRVIALKDGAVLVNGTSVGTYATGGELDRSWRALLAAAGALDTRGVITAARAWHVATLPAAEKTSWNGIETALRDLSAPPAEAEAAAAQAVAAARGDSAASQAVTPAEAAKIAADEAAHEDVAPAPQAAPAVIVQRGAWDHLFADVRNVIGVFIALAMTGFGLVFFGRRYLEVVSDTARHSFGRSFVTGVLGQLLMLPTLAMLIVGLVFTLVGILLLPFAVVAFILAACGAILGGYLAIAHAVGETFTRRRMANGAVVRAPNAYGYLFSGLIGLLGLWAAAALFGWAGPVVLLFRLAAVIVSWVAATAGFGAVLLSRAGLRETFSGRVYGEMSDEYLWATPPATPTAARMGKQP